MIILLQLLWLHIIFSKIEVRGWLSCLKYNPEVICSALFCQVCGLGSTFRMSTVTHLGSFVTDEVIGDAMPMTIKVFNSKIELMVREDLKQ